MAFLTQATRYRVAMACNASAACHARGVDWYPPTPHRHIINRRNIANGYARGACSSRKKVLQPIGPWRVDPSAALSCMGQSLLEMEQQSLQLCMDQVLGDGQMSPSSGHTLQEHLIVYLKESVSANPEDLRHVEGAMLLLEQLNNQVAESSNVSGRWQMVFTTAGFFPRLQFIPVREFLDIEDGGTKFSIDTDLPLLHTSFTGPCEWLSTGHFKYRVTAVKLKLGPVKFCIPLPFPETQLAFFGVEDQVACARSSSGGLILLLAA